MTNNEFSAIRKKLKKTQKQMSEILGGSVKAVSSYEQGWRQIPTHIERQLYFLLSRRQKTSSGRKPCWIIKKCPSNLRNNCPAWEFDAGKFCWLVNGGNCQCLSPKNCNSCDVMKSLFAENAKNIVS